MPQIQGIYNEVPTQRERTTVPLQELTDTTSIVTTLFIHPRVADLYARLGYILFKSRVHYPCSMCSLVTGNI